MSFIQDFAGLMSARVLSELLGLPEADIPEFTRDVYTLAPALSSSFSRGDVPQLQSAAEKLSRYADELLRAREAEPRNDFLTSYIHELGQAGTLTPLETLIQVVTVILAGSETTRITPAGTRCSAPVPIDVLGRFSPGPSWRKGWRPSHHACHNCGWLASLQSRKAAAASARSRACR